MFCPRDATQLVRVKVDGIELDRCPECLGVWLDSGELGRLYDLRLTHVEEKLEDDDQDAAGPPSVALAYMRCPVCPTGRLQQITYTYMHPVRIDRCDVCLGVWVDAKELNAIVGEKKQVDQEYSIHRLRDFLKTALPSLGIL